MADTSGSTILKTTKPDGSRWLQMYTRNGVQWVPWVSWDEEGDAAPRPQIPPGGASPLHVALAVADVSTQIMTAPEVRRQRQLAEAIHEERRLDWLQDMLVRFAEASSA